MKTRWVAALAAAVLVMGCWPAAGADWRCGMALGQFPPELENGVYPRHYRPARTVDAENLTLDIRVIMEDQAVEGEVRLRIKPIHDSVTEIVLDAVRMEIRDVALDPYQSLDWNYSDNKLYIETETPLAGGPSLLTVSFYSTMKNREFAGPFAGEGGMYFADTEDRDPPVWNQMHTLNEPFGAANWFPCLDYPNDRMVTEMIVTVPERFATLSNGALINQRPAEDGWRTDHWRQEIPHVIYLISLVVGEFAIVEDDWRGVPVPYYVEPDHVGDAIPSWGRTPDMIEFFSDYTGVPYPYEKYAQVHVRDFRAGGMEHTTATTLFENAIITNDARLDNDMNGLVAHELVHQWFGDLLTCESWGELWLNESFATYFDALWHEHDEGENSFLEKMRGNMRSYIGGSNRYTRPIVTNTFKNPSEMFDHHSYPKGACVLHMLRNELGDDLFRESVRLYTREHYNGLVDTDDWMEAIEAATGRPMDRFFEQWVFRAGHPKVEVEQEYLSGMGMLKLTIRQTQETEEGEPAFAFPLEVIVHTENGSVMETVPVSLREETAFIECPPPLAIEIDPKLHVLMELDFSKPEDMLLRELRDGSTIISRIRAAEALAENKAGRVVNALLEAAKTDPYWLAQAEAVNALGEIRTDAARDALLELAEHPHPKVRDRVADQLGKFHKDEQAIQALIGRFANDESINVISSAARALGRAGLENGYAVLSERIGQESWGNRIHFAVMDALVQLEEPEAFSSLKQFAEPGHRREIRAHAIRNLGVLAEAAGVHEGEALNALTRYLDSDSADIRRAAAQGLGALGDEAALDALRPVSRDDPAGNVREAASNAMEEIRERESELAAENATRVEELEDQQKKLEERIEELETLVDKLIHGKDAQPNGEEDGDE